MSQFHSFLPQDFCGLLFDSWRCVEESLSRSRWWTRWRISVDSLRHHQLILVWLLGLGKEKSAEGDKNTLSLFVPKGCLFLDTGRRIALIENLFWSEHFYSVWGGGRGDKHILLAIMEINNINFSRMILIYFSLQSLGHLANNMVPEQKLNGNKVGNSYSNGKLGQGEEKKLWK